MGFVIFELDAIDKRCELENLLSGTFVVATQVFRQLLIQCRDGERTKRRFVKLLVTK